jgi:hypothetical protein
MVLVLLLTLLLVAMFASLARVLVSAALTW